MGQLMFMFVNKCRFVEQQSKRVQVLAHIAQLPGVHSFLHQPALHSDALVP